MTDTSETIKHSGAFDAIAENLGYLTDWEDRYRYIIELGHALPPLDEADRTPANKVHGCASQVWLATRQDVGTLTYTGDSDAMIVKGLVAIVIALYSGRTPEDIARTDAIAVFDQLGLREHLTTQRSNGLVAMVNRIRNDARTMLAA
jgi:cysteine desulfuration protein SufE